MGDQDIKISIYKLPKTFNVSLTLYIMSRR